ncbi:ClpP/crotonase-like domain-containing protein [Triangularia verruculosa]|uniref:3-hydroxyisobutyryl-CoA hydrolase n=1 Tax=Triangularia verruculosa TaxID=2587418 RepID=A0AAN7AZ28_9PEZI|nr:ClpP/crotonase-like domain-containing protein [Triangularia verruculosa]
MPLRAKLLSQQQQPQLRTMASSSVAHFPPAPTDEPEDVLFQSLYGLRTIELNRPKKLNALNGSMIRKIGPRLLEWSKSDMANVVVMKGAGPRAFCAGGDVEQLAKWNKTSMNGTRRSATYFGQEYKLDHLIATYNKPYIAFMDGITMGGGVGLSIHAPFRIATERTMFAMPETTIGFFPDVGASFFLPRMEGFVGTYLALTSARLQGPNVFYAGVATHYLHSTSLNALESRLAELKFRDHDDLKTRLGVVNATIEEFVTGLPYDQPIALAGEVRKAIDRCFRHDSVGEIVKALERERERENPVTKGWAEETLETLHKRSPTSVHVTLKQMRIGAQWDIAETFRREHSIATKFMDYPDFNEGVSAVLIEKTHEPKWEPASLEEFAKEDRTELVDSFFLEGEGSKKLELLNGETYSEYPFANYGVPTEKEVEEKIAEGKAESRGEVVEYFVRARRQKQGVKELVSEILSRKTRDGEEGLVWVYEE